MTIKNVPDDVYRRLKKSARLNRRSLNSEAIVLLERSLGDRRRSVEDSLAALRRLHERLRDLPPLDDEFLGAAKARDVRSSLEAAQRPCCGGTTTGSAMCEGCSGS